MSLMPEEQEQDGLRVVRAFVGAMQGYLGPDQSYGYQDGGAGLYSPPRQFTVIGPQGVAIEGQPIIAAAPAGGGLVLSPVLIWVGIGALVYAVLKG